MILKMFSIYDRQSEIHQPPAFFHTVGHALRGLSRVFTDPDSVFCQHAADFQVFEIGTYDDQTGRVLPIDQLHLVCSGTEIKASFAMTVPLKGTPDDPDE